MALAPVAQNWLVFIDTNIMLDFYRLPGESAERQIAGLQKHLNSVIVTEQVRMEFLKHRQRVISDSIKQIAKPSKVSLPMIVTASQAATTLSRHLSEASDAHKRVQEKVEKILADPANHDPVYQGLNRLFATNSPLNLKRPDALRFQIRNRARKRFVLGYPPRKSGDTSIGDALNWEWIVHCAQQSQANHNILIVSRDGDYGLTHGGKVILNDWLKQEFKSRVSRRRKIEITNKLTDALKKLDEVVSAEDEQAEETLIESSRATWQRFLATTSAKFDDDEEFIRRLNFHLAELSVGTSDDE